MVSRPAPARRQHRQCRRISAGTLLVLAAPFAHFAAASQLGAQSRAERDSLNANLVVLNSLRYFEYRLDLIERQAGSPPGVFAVCEIPVAEFCYGPKNGKIAFGGFGTRLGSRNFKLTRFERGFQRTFARMIDAYLDTLRTQLKKVPNDRWMLSELVRLNVDRGNNIQAFEAIEGCSLDEWWCDALRAYVMQISGVFLRADTVWLRALHAMPDFERCAWLDPTWVSDDKAFNTGFQEASCEEKQKIAERVWWLSDPLYSVEGNERRSEHLARVMELLLKEGHRRRRSMTPAMVLRTNSQLPESVSVTAELDGKRQLSRPPWKVVLPWGYAELVMRVGPPVFIIGTEEGELTIAQYPHPRVSFVPKASVFSQHLKALSTDWNLADPYAFEFVTGWTHTFTQLESQLAYFRRGDSALVVAAADVRGDSILSRPGAMSQLFLQRDYDQPVFRSVGDGVEVHRFTASSIPESTLVSLEIRGVNGSWGRTRFAAGPQTMPAQRVALSDVMLLEARDDPPASVAEAASRALGTTSIIEQARVSAFWEMYGLSAGETPSISVIVTRERGSPIGELLRGIFSGAAVDSLSVSWEEAAVEGRDIEPRSVTLDLRTLAPARYTISVVMDLAGQERVISRRRVEIIARRT